MISFLVMGSGSKGNATFIYDAKTLFQIDMGISLTRVKEGLKTINRKRGDIEAIFITHEHSDHISTLPLLSSSTKVFASPLTPIEGKEVIVCGIPVKLGSFLITSFHSSHDAADPVGYLIVNEGEKLAYLTDTGYINEESLALLGNCDYYIIESNHDLKMLFSSHRPASLKQRIHSDVGHLSNTESACYMRSLVGPKTKGIYLAHLSEECNTEELALETYKASFREAGVSLDAISLVCCKQYEAVKGGDV